MIERPCSNGCEQLLGHALLGRPRERQPLDAVGVRVLRRGERRPRGAELAQQVVERLLDDLAVALVAGDDPARGGTRGEQRVVVEHLLEVRHEPRSSTE